MNLGQTMLSAGALVLLTILVINAHRLVVQSGDAAVSAEAAQVGIDLAQSLLDEIQTKKFDQFADTSGSQAVSEFTAPASLGPGAGESFTLPDTIIYKSIGKYNDVDDYHGYTRNTAVGQFAGYQLSVTVVYVDDDDPDVVVATRTYTKRVQVTVINSKYFKNMTFAAVVSYSSS
ncbi:MAG: hypothetical protein IH628_11655 [Proteobacteria bacterium]|nr:hypothetical protein [Pseudomonadota bacterium]